ncbi:MAG: BtpA/SgcQ family protein [Acidobacteriota bacterium]|nr:BtpA/SgcQ family protein [Acidobacteriota bacterium]
MFKKSKAVIGMIHVGALPGTPNYRGPIKDLIARARWEAAVYADAGIDMIALENMHDVPYLKRRVGPEVTACMAVIAHEVKQAVGLPCGLQILAGANKDALAAALAAGLDFIRAEGFAFAHVADEGFMESDAGELLRYRRAIDALTIPILADIKKKHSAHAVTADVSIAQTAEAAAFFGADGVIVTGQATGASADLSELEQVSAAVDVPVLVGSGVTQQNVISYLAHADAILVGSYFKVDGNWRNQVDTHRVKPFMDKVREWRDAR